MNRALFLDRDGVINVEKNYLYKIEDVEFIDGIFDLCREYQNRGYIIIIVTNQSGIARGYYDEGDFAKLSEWMIEQFTYEKITIKQIYHCPHHPDISGECRCRKPKAGMLLDAMLRHNIDMSNSIIIGDKERDIEAGVNAGLKECYLFDEKEEVLESKATKIVSRLGDILTF